MGRRGRAGFRRPGGGGGGLGSGGGSFQAIFGANLRYLFDARAGSVAGSWTDQIQGYNLTNIAVATAYAADGGNFNGLPVHQTAVAGPAVLRLTAPAPAAWSAGANPYFMIVGRFRAYPAGNAMLARVLDAPFGSNTLALQTSAGVNILGIVDGVSASTAFSNTNVHTFELWGDGVNANLSIDGAAPVQVGAAPIVNNSGPLSVGGSHTGTLMCDASLALWLGCVTKPTDGQRAQARALARATWGF